MSAPPASSRRAQSASSSSGSRNSNRSELQARMQRKISRIKAEARSELTPEAWQRYGFADRPELWMPRSQPFPPDSRLARIDYSAVDEEEFVRQVEKTNTPAVISNALKSWPAMNNWTFEKLAKNYANQRFKCGEDDEGYPLRIKMKYYLEYMKSNRDDSPLYIFESVFAEKEGKDGLRRDYDIPKYFRDDLFSYAGEARRPPYRWFVMGPKRSGTGIHIDPLGTSAWNAVVYGQKRWALFPPTVPKAALQVAKGDGDREAITWFARVLPKTLAPDWPYARPLQFVQSAGDLVFIPGGWHHVVLNITDTIAVTQNFASPTNFPFVWRRTVRGRPKLSKKWLQRLQAARPEIAAIAARVDLEADDGYPLSTSSSSSSSSSSDSSASDSESDDGRPSDKEVNDSKADPRLSKSRGRREGGDPGRKKSKAKLCLCEECLRKCELCRAYVAQGLTPPAH